MTLDSVLRCCKELLLPVMQKHSLSCACGVRENSEPRKNLSCLLAAHNYTSVQLAIPFLASQVSRHLGVFAMHASLQETIDRTSTTAHEAYRQIMVSKNVSNPESRWEISATLCVAHDKLGFAM